MITSCTTSAWRARTVATNSASHLRSAGAHPATARPGSTGGRGCGSVVADTARIHASAWSSSARVVSDSRRHIPSASHSSDRTTTDDQWPSRRRSPMSALGIASSAAATSAHSRSSSRGGRVQLPHAASSALSARDRPSPPASPISPPARFRARPADRASGPSIVASAHDADLLRVGATDRPIGSAKVRHNPRADCAWKCVRRRHLPRLDQQNPALQGESRVPHRTHAAEMDSR